MKTKTKKEKTVYESVLVTYDGYPNPRAFATRIAVKVALLCMIAGGLCATLAELYYFPLEPLTAAITGAGSVVFFHWALMRLRRRVLLIPGIVLLWWLAWGGAGTAATAIGHYINHLLISLNSRLLPTGAFTLFAGTPDRLSVMAVFLLGCVLLSLLFTLVSRTRAVGLMTAAAVLLLIPAFIAEIARYTWGFVPLIAGLIGYYALWLGNSYREKFAPAPEPDEKKLPVYALTPAKPPHYYRYSKNAAIIAVITTAAMLISSAAVSTPIKFEYQAIVSAIRDIKLPRNWQEFLKHTFGSINTNGFMGQNSRGGIGATLDLNNPPPKGGTPVVRLTLENGANGRNDKLYLRGGIFTEMRNGEWVTGSRSQEYRRLESLMNTFAPELEYHTFREAAVAVYGHNPLPEYSVYRSFSGFDTGRVHIEYLARADFALMPTNPYDLGFRADGNFRRNGDTVITPARRVREHEFATLYPVVDDYAEIGYKWSDLLSETFIDTLRFVSRDDGRILTFVEVYEEYWKYISENETMLWYSEITSPLEFTAPRMSEFEFIETYYDIIVVSPETPVWNFPELSEITPQEYNAQIGEYRSLIHSVYTQFPEEEAANIDLFLREIGYRSHEEAGEENVESVFPPEIWESLDPQLRNYMRIVLVESNYHFDSDDDEFYYDSYSLFGFAQYLENLLRSRYAYSLTVNNRLPGNTTLGNFLHETRQGHCVMYATAMTLAMRRLGVPARVVTGLVATSSGGSVQEKRESDFHAWTEVYFPGLGWIPFDPTGGVDGSESGNTGTPATPRPTAPTTEPTTTPPAPATTPPSATGAPPTTTPAVTTGGDSQGSQSLNINWGIIALISLIVLVPALAILAAVTALKRLRLAEERRFARWRTASREHSTELFRFALALLNYKGVTATSGETALEFAERIREKFAECDPPRDDYGLPEIMPLFVKSEFGRELLPEDEYARVCDYVERLYEEIVLSAKQPRRLLLRVKFS